MASTVSSTTLTFGMVSAPVSVKKVKESTDVSFTTLDPEERPCGTVWAVKSDVTGKDPAVPQDPDAIELVPFVPGEKGKMKQDTRKGVALGGGKYREIPAETIKLIDEACSIDSIDITAFIPLDEVPLERSEGAYFIAPQRGVGAAAVKPLVLLREALDKAGRAGIGKLTFRSRQRPFVIYAKDGGLVLNTLVFAQDFAQFSEAAEVLDGVTADEKQVAMAITLVEAMAGGIDDLNALTDDAREQREALMAQALNGEVIEVPDVEKPEATIDLEAALLASVGAMEAKATAKPKAKAKAKPKAKAVAA